MSTVSTPAAAARTGARPKMMNGGPASVSVSVAAPPPPVRKKKKSSAPSPPSSRGGRPVNSTMTSSATSLLSVKEDISYIRPQSAMSVASLSSVSTVRSHKKRRAPPPPVKITTVVDAAEIVPPSDSVDNTVNVNGYSHDNHDVYATVHKITKEDTITINDEVIADDGANDGYEFGESAIILSDENEDGDHIYEKIDFTNSVSNNSYDDQDFVDEIPVFQSDLLSIEDNSKSTAQDLEEEKSELNVSTEDKGTPRSEIDQGETISIEQVKINGEILSNEDASKSEQEEKKKDKKKKKSKDKTSKDKSKKKKKKDETTTEDLENSTEFAHKKTKDIVLKREQSDTKNAENNYTEPELPSFRGAKAAKVHEINEVEENSEEKRSASSPALDNVESDALVDSDDDLVDLFTIASRSKQQNKSAASDIKNADSAKQEKQRDNKLMDDMTSDDELAELANNLGDSTYLSEEEELQDKLKSVPKKLSGKEIEEMKKNEIRQSMPTTSSILNNRKVSEVYLEMKSEEALRHELKILQLGDTDPAQQQPGRRRVELDIELEEEEVLVLGSLPSSRASSVANLEEAAQAEARRELDHQFAVRELQARAGAGVRTVEAEEDEEKYLTVHDAVIMEAEPRDADAAVSSDNEVTQSPAHRIEEPRVSAEVPEILNINVGQHDLGTVTRDAGGDRDNNGGADSIKSPSPDSGIHDFTDSCSSPVSCAAQEDGAAAGPSNAASWSQLGDIHIKAQEAAVIGLDRVELRQDYRGHEEPPPDSGDVSEKVEMPKTHNLNRVLFSMSSYNDRKCVEQSGDLFRTQSYSALADKLNTSLAARQKLKHAGAGGLVPGTGPGETKPPVPARNFGKKYAGSSSSRGQGGARPQPSPHPPSPDAGLTHAAAAAGQSAARNPISRPHAAHADTAAASFRSRIIEEFQAKKGVLILGRSHSSGSSAPAPPAADPGMEHYSSLDRGGGHLARARPRREEESHYASPRALLGPSVSLGVWGARQQQQDSSSGHLQLSPPAASSSSGSGGPHPALQQHKQIEIRYKNGQAKEVIEDPRKFVLQGSRTSRGDYKNEAGFKTHRGHVTEDTGRPKQHEHYDLEPAIIPKISEKKVREDPVRNDEGNSSSSSLLPHQTFYFGQSPAQPRPGATPPAPATTAVGKVKHNEALSQPFRHQPRHEPRKSSSNTLPKSNAVPKHNENEPRIVIVKSRAEDSDYLSMNNNQPSVRNLNSAGVRPKERDQAEINREFQTELLRTKAKLSKVQVQRSAYLGDSQDTPPPPPPPVLPGAPPPAPPPLVKPAVKSSSRPPPASLNAREELMMAIRSKGGAGGLRKTGLSNL